ncbi:MAG: RRXRR domain-containing protein [Clostridiales bacterium]|jgi:N6-L-threonylcarbamoyladenine synthase|nr:RRXRR domain-containing protein [Clostridiales bacterium]
MQPISLGVDAGSKAIGISAAAEKEELYAAEAELRTDIVDLLSTRRAFNGSLYGDIVVKARVKGVSQDELWDMLIM